MTTKYAVIFVEYGYGEGEFFNTFEECQQWADEKDFEIRQGCTKQLENKYNLFNDAYIPVFSIHKLIYDEKTVIPDWGDYDGSKYVVYIPCGERKVELILTNRPITEIINFQIK